MASSRLRPVTDVSAADWLTREIGPFGTGVGGLIPPRFASYARILHPARSADEEPVSWASIAEWSGGVIHPHVQFSALARPRPGSGQCGAPWVEGPAEGELPVDLLSVLCDLLGNHTGTPQRCWFCLWEGYGWIHGAPAVAVSGDSTPVPPAFPREIIDGPRVRLPERDYILFQGPLTAALEMGWTPRPDEFVPQSPNLFWPDDHAWCVATEVDLDSTYIGGSARLVEDLLADPRLEVLPASPADPITASSDEIN